MAWKKTESLLKRRLRQHGLADMVDAGILCKKAEELYPGLFRAVSVKNDCLHLELRKENHLQFTMIRGKLQEEVSQYAMSQNLPKIERIRLTFSQE